MTRKLLSGVAFAAVLSGLFGWLAVRRGLAPRPTGAHCVEPIVRSADALIELESQAIDERAVLRLADLDNAQGLSAELLRDDVIADGYHPEKIDPFIASRHARKTSDNTKRWDTFIHSVD